MLTLKGVKPSPVQIVDNMMAVCLHVWRYYIFLTTPTSTQLMHDEFFLFVCFQKEAWCILLL